MLMFEIGKINRLKVSRESPHGWYLFWEKTEVLMPKKYITPEILENGYADVIVYADSEDRLVATTENVFAYADEFAWLKIVAKTTFGVFADWGAEKNLLIPLREQAKPLEEGDYAIVRVCVDYKTGRLFGSTKFRSLMTTVNDEIEKGDAVKFLLVEKTPLGFLCIVNDAFEGLLLAQDAPAECSVGSKMNGFAKNIREDGKVDILLRKEGLSGLRDESEKILLLLKQNGGFLPFTDASSPDDILKFFAMSKKAFKRAVGILMKEKKVIQEADKIRLQ